MLRHHDNKKKNRSGRTTTLQLEQLVQYMETHSEFASNKFLTKEGRVHHNQQWAELGKMLNELTKGPGKTTKQWQTVWRDIKSNTSKKASKLRNEKNRTGNFPINADPLDNLEQRVIAYMGLEYIQDASNVPDSTPEEEEYQIQLENGNENVLQIPPTTTSIGDCIHVDVRQNNINNALTEKQTCRSQ
ncbi:uncharacterized protein LOC116853446 [Odontomachus brunneus]|uniref:uncharacterized protein LOC116853446 n=1 Tax=Odontomachus brunneus TaxID=486640 RepID=UPI0013F257AD|nr:uncharacterized protein LOC116853446 [Odontomachus brunneus]